MTAFVNDQYSEYHLVNSVIAHMLSPLSYHISLFFIILIISDLSRNMLRSLINN